MCEMKDSEETMSTREKSIKARRLRERGGGGRERRKREREEEERERGVNKQEY